MTVAVKNTPETRVSSPFDRLPVASLVGAVYVLASIAIILKGLPALVWTWLGLSQQSFPAWFLLIAGMLAALAGLAYMGARLAGPSAPRGMRAGIVVALIGIGLIALITRWASAAFERWSFDRHWFGPEVGLGLTAAVGLGLFALAGWCFFRPGFESFLRRFEEQGWFSAVSYKPNQGLRVRRGTTLGVLLLALPGIYLTMQRLKLGERDWAVELPFTGLVSVREPGDVAAAGIEVNFRDDVVILDPGDWPDFKAQQFVNKGVFDDVEEQLKGTVKIREGDAGRFDSDDFVNRDALIVTKPAFERVRASTTGALVSLPTKLPRAARVLDRYEMQRVNAELQRNYVRVTKASQFEKFKEGDVILAGTFDQVVDDHQEKIRKLEDEANQLKEKGDSFAAQPLLDEARTIRLDLPAKTEPYSMDGDTRHDRMTLVPQVKIVVPLVLLAGVIWLAWRIVNLPTFADFLIATEAELNKVSWTSRKRLVQDTVVVLVATMLITAFLLFSDVVWSWLLQRVGVLRTGDKDAAAQQEDPDW
jgi:preprotein translocase SecE subunit